ncbi:MAG: hypothetical protein MZW92_26060 [Comamonadaceae bacterium]|nr:hypothetical protein [Comamonadaceae bacterium]
MVGDVERDHVGVAAGRPRSAARSVFSRSTRRAGQHDQPRRPRPARARTARPDRCEAPVTSATRPERSMLYAIEELPLRGRRRCTIARARHRILASTQQPGPIVA